MRMKSIRFIIGSPKILIFWESGGISRLTV